VLYLAIVETIRRVWDWTEWRMTRHLRPAEGAARTQPVEGMPDALTART
jgi:hypothetical protein